MYTMVKLAKYLRFMEKKIILLVEFIFYIAAYWGRLMVFIFICACGCRREKNNFLHLILSSTLSHCHCTFNILKFNTFFFLIDVFVLIKLLYIALSLKFGLKYLICLVLVASAIRRRKNIKILLRLSAPVRKSLI